VSIRRRLAEALSAGAARFGGPKSEPLLYRTHPGVSSLPKSAEEARRYLERSATAHDAAMARLDAARRRYRAQTGPQTIQARGRRRSTNQITAAGGDWRHGPASVEERVNRAGGAMPDPGRRRG
jgi:hypothetical protein